MLGDPFTAAVNCCVLVTTTLAAVGLTATATGVLCEVLAQPASKTHTQLRPLGKKVQRMNILTGGPGPISKQESQRGWYRQHLPMALDYKRGKRDVGEDLGGRLVRRRFGTPRIARLYSISGQLAPIQISTSVATESLC